MTAAATAGASEPVVHSYLWLVMLAAEAVVVAWMDQLLWLRGQEPAIKARPRHRCRTSYY